MSGLVGFSQLTDRLAKGVRTGRAAHAQIFLGPQGSGKRSLARIYARALLCTGKGERPCDFCGSCRRMAHGNHPDYIEIRPSDGTVKVGDVEALQAEIIIRPYEGGRKVVVLLEADTMNAASQNKLLKVLEEPPPYATLLLLCRTSAPILETVRSRCQIIRMPRVPMEMIAALLAERFGLDPSRAATLSAMSDGRVGRALELASSPGTLSRRDESLGLLEEALGRGGALRTLESLGKNRDDARRVLLVWQDILRDALVAKNDGGRVIHADRTGRIGALAAAFSRDELAARLEAVVAAERRLRGNGALLTVCHKLLLTMGGYTQS